VKVLYHFRTRGTGGEGVHIAGIANALVKLGYEIELSSPTGVDPRESQGSTPFSGKEGGGLLSRLAARAPGFLFEFMEVGYNLAAWWRNRGLLEAEKYDLIYERHAFFLFSTALLARRFKIPLVVEVNELVCDERIRKQPLLKPVALWSDRFLLGRADRVVVVSPHLKRRIVELGIEEGKVIVLPNAIDEVAFSEVGGGQRVREKFSLGSSVVIGFVGWLVHWHNLPGLVSGLARVRDQGYDAKLLMVGDGTLQEELEAQAAEVGVRDHLVFAGAVTRAEIAEYVCAMDIATIPQSNAYRSPLKLFEYMALERAVVAPATEPIEMVLRDGENAVLFDQEDENGLEKALLRYLADPGLRARTGVQARSDCLAHHTWTANALASIEGLSGTGS